MFNSKVALFAALLFAATCCWAQTTAYYIVTVTGDGKSIETAYRPVIHGTKDVDYSAVIASNPDGSPKNSWALVKATTLDQSTVTAIVGVDKVPIADFNTKASDISTTDKTGFTSKLTVRGIDSSFMNTAKDGKEIIDALVKMHDPTTTADAVK